MLSVASVAGMDNIVHTSARVKAIEMKKRRVVREARGDWIKRNHDAVTGENFDFDAPEHYRDRYLPTKNIQTFYTSDESGATTDGSQTTYR